MTKTSVVVTTLFAAATIMMGGCSSISGLSGSSDYGCKAPPGVRCDSVSGTYENALRGALPSQQPGAMGAPASRRGEAAGARPGETGELTRVRMATSEQEAGPRSPSGPMPLRSQDRVLRLWFKPWVDADRDLFDQGFIYVQVDGGQWLVDHVRRQIREGYAPVRAPMNAAAAVPASTDKSKPQGFRGPLNERPPADEATDVIEEVTKARTAAQN